MGGEGGFGVVFKIGDGNKASTPDYTAIAQVEDFNGVDVKSIMAETTAHDSAGGFRKKVPSGLFEMSDIELGLVFDITQGTHANSSGGLIHALLNKTHLAYQIIFPDASDTTWTFDAYVSGIKWESPKDNKIGARVTLTVDGQPTLT